MKFGTLLPLLTLVATSQAGQKVNVVVNNRADVPIRTLTPAEGYASRILAAADVTLTWRNGITRVANGADRTLILNLEINAPETSGQRSLGYSLAFEGVHAWIFYRPIQRISGPTLEPFVLAHAIAHEIAHLLARTDTHSRTGVMKEKWDWRDICDMRLHPLRFTADDIRRIRAAEERTSLKFQQVSHAEQ